MKFYQISFFTSKNSPKPEVEVRYNEDESWPVTVALKGVRIYMNLNEWIDFKNSVIQSDRVITEKVLGREHYE